MARNIQDSELYRYANKVREQTVVITGAANGLGKAAALEFGKRGANVIIGDIDVMGAEKTASEIKAAGGSASFQSCNVLEYKQIVSLFEHAVSRYGTVDIVIPNAGVTEIGRFTSVDTDEQGLPKKPNLKTLEINIISVLYTTHVTIHYFSKNKKADALKALVLVGSMASISGLPGGPLYGTSKHGVLGLMRSLAPEFELYGWRIAAVTPWFADTNIIPTAMKLALAGVPMVPIYKVAGAMFLAATDEEPGSLGAAYTLPDEREVFRIPPTEINEGVYQIMNDRAKRAKSAIQGIKTLVAISGIFLKSSVFKLLLTATTAYYAYLFTSSHNNPADILSRIQNITGRNV